MNNANVPGVGRASGKSIEWLRGLAVYVVPLGLCTGLWILAGLYYAAIDRQNHPTPPPAVVVPPLLPSVSYAEKDEPFDSFEAFFG